MRAEIHLAMCIPTYCRSAMIQDVFSWCGAIYINAGIDLYYYDSSPDNDTKHLVLSWKERYPDSIFYVRMPTEMHANMKAYKIFQLYGLEKDYDFIWLCSDSIMFYSPAIEQIISFLDPQYDLIEANCRDKEQLGTRIYEDHNQYLVDCAWELTSFGAAIINTRTILRGVDWEYYEKKYNKPKLVNFSHVSFYFERFHEMGKFKALHLSIDSKWGKWSTLKKSSGWYNDLFFIWCEAWPSSINILPDQYTTKADAIKRHGQYTLHLFWKYRFDGLYSFSVFWKYLRVWKSVCDIPLWKLLLISLIPLKVCLIYNGIAKAFECNRLKYFCWKHSEVYLYGAGKAGSRYAAYMKDMGLNFQAFCVKDGTKNPMIYCGHDVCTIASLADKKKQIGIVVALGVKLGYTVYMELKEQGYKHIFFSPDLYSLLAKYGSV